MGPTPSALGFRPATKSLRTRIPPPRMSPCCPARDKFDPKKGEGVRAGGFFTAEKDMQHYGWTTRPAVIQIHGHGAVRDQLRQSERRSAQRHADSEEAIGVSRSLGPRLRGDERLERTTQPARPAPCPWRLRVVPPAEPRSARHSRRIPSAPGPS